MANIQLNRTILQLVSRPCAHQQNLFISTSALRFKKVAGRYQKTPHQTNPLTYEQANLPHQIGVTKTWNSWNTSFLLDGVHIAETQTEDLIIRKFMAGTWHGLFLSEVIIKRRANMIILGGLITRAINPRKVYFLIGYSEEILSYLFKCPVKIELQTVADKKDIIYTYV